MLEHLGGSTTLEYARVCLGTTLSPAPEVTLFPTDVLIWRHGAGRSWSCHIRLTSRTLARYRLALAAPVASPPGPDTTPLAPPPARDVSLPMGLGVSYDGLDALEVEVIQSSDFSPENLDDIALDLLRDFVDPEIIVGFGSSPHNPSWIGAGRPDWGSSK